MVSYSPLSPFVRDLSRLFVFVTYNPPSGLLLVSIFSCVKSFHITFGVFFGKPIKNIHLNGYTCVYVAEFLHCLPEIITILLIGYSESEAKSLSCVRLFETLWTVAHQAPPSMGFSRQEYWSGVPFPSPGDLPDPGSEPVFPVL